MHNLCLLVCMWFTSTTILPYVPQIYCILRDSRTSTVIMLKNKLLFLYRGSSGVQSQPPRLLVQLHALLLWWSCAVWGHAGRATCGTFDQQHQCSARFHRLVNIWQTEDRVKRKQEVDALVKLWGKEMQKHPWSKSNCWDCDWVNYL